MSLSFRRGFETLLLTFVTSRAYLNTCVCPKVTFIDWAVHARSMAKLALDELLSTARAELHDKNTVTLLGKTKAGKTVVSVLLDHALFNKFIPTHSHKFNAVAKNGGERIDNIMRTMRTDGLFPQATASADTPRLELVIHKITGERAGESRLVLQDSSGEKYTSLLHEEVEDPSERLQEILAYNNRKGEVGPLAPYVFSKIYLLAIECPEDDSMWDLQHASSTIETLYEIHKAAQLTHNQKIKTHIAILFTKADILGEMDKGAPAHMLLERMEQLKSALRMRHGGDLACFKLSIASERESDLDRDERVRARNRENKRLQRQYRKDMDEYVSECVMRAKQEAGPEVEGDALDQYVEEAASQAEESFRNSYPAPPEIDEHENKHEYKVKKGFEYSQGEYVRLISWIMDRLYD